MIHSVSNPSKRFIPAGYRMFIHARLPEGGARSQQGHSHGHIKVKVKAGVRVRANSRESGEGRGCDRYRGLGQYGHRYK